MKLESYLCLGGTEIGNVNRVLAYLERRGTGHWSTYAQCACTVLNPYDGATFGIYSSPEADPAPWYDANRVESMEFLGLLPANIELGNVLGREMFSLADEGGVLGRPKLRPRVVSVSGLLAASTARGMMYGERWLTEALRGCGRECGGDDLKLLPVCPTGSLAADINTYFKTVVNAGTIDYAPPSPLGQDSPACYVQQVAFQIASEMPWLYSAPTACMDDNAIAAGVTEYCLSEVGEWPGDATFVFQVEATGGDITSVLITARPTFNDTCPPNHGGNPCFSYKIDSMERDGIFTIDGRQRKVTYNDPSIKSDRLGFPLLDPYVLDTQNGDLFVWPDVDACTDLCIEITNNGASSITVNVDRYDREL